MQDGASMFQYVCRRLANMKQLTAGRLLMLQVIKFTYRLLPSGSAFSVEYPEPRRLSPGMSATIRVRVIGWCYVLLQQQHAGHAVHTSRRCQQWKRQHSSWWTSQCSEHW
jgi:hypothetical protein